MHGIIKKREFCVCSVRGSLSSVKSEKYWWSLCLVLSYKSVCTPYKNSCCLYHICTSVYNLPYFNVLCECTNLWSDRLLVWAPSFRSLSHWMSRGRSSSRFLLVRINLLLEQFCHQFKLQTQEPVYCYYDNF